MYRIILTMSILQPNSDGSLRTTRGIIKKNNINSYGLEEESEMTVGYLGQLEIIPIYYLENYTDKLEIIVLTTKETIAPVEFVYDGVGRTDSAYVFFQNRIREMSNQKGFGDDHVSFKQIYVEEDFYAKAISEVVEHLKENHNEDADKLWIDLHGGPRENIIPLLSIVSLLDVYNINCDRILTTRFDNNNSRIVDASREVEALNFMTGIREFMEYGSVKILASSESREENSTLIDIMNRISDGMRICDSLRYKDSLEDLREYFKKNNSNDSQKYLDIFENYIYEDYKELIECTEDEMSLYIVKRCTEKRMYQQALTFLETLMPSMFYQSKVFVRNPKQRLVQDDKAIFDIFVNELFGYQVLLDESDLTNTDDKEENKNTFLKSIKELRAYKVVKRVSNNPKEIIFPNELRKKTDNEIIQFNYNSNKGEAIIRTFLNVKDEYKEKLERLLILHGALKRCRNASNHVIINAARPTNDEIKEALDVYYSWCCECLWNSDITLFEDIREISFDTEYVFLVDKLSKTISKNDKLEGFVKDFPETGKDFPGFIAPVTNEDKAKLGITDSKDWNKSFFGNKTLFVKFAEELVEEGKPIRCNLVFETDNNNETESINTSLADKLQGLSLQTPSSPA